MSLHHREEIADRGLQFHRFFSAVSVSFQLLFAPVATSYRCPFISASDAAISFSESNLLLLASSDLCLQLPLATFFFKFLSGLIFRIHCSDVAEICFHLIGVFTRET